MTTAELQNLARIGQLKQEPSNARELAGLKASGESRLRDAQRADLAFESRFDLAFNAAHSLALFALRRLGYRSENRYLVFQVLPHTLGLQPAQWRVLAKAHNRRNLAEYEGHLEHDEQLLTDLIAAAQLVWEQSAIFPMQRVHRKRADFLHFESPGLRRACLVEGLSRSSGRHWPQP